MTNSVVLPKGIDFFERGWLSSNNVLLHDREQSILVDTGYWTHAQQTVDLVRSVLGMASLNIIINTHLHSDHCGGNSLLQKQFPNAVIKVPPGHKEYVDNWDPVALSYTPTGQFCPPFNAGTCIKPGDSFIIADGEWQAYSAPGHDPNSIILFNDKEKTLISADALWEKGFGVVFPEIEGINAFHEVGLTLDLIECLKPEIVLPGHGKPFRDVEKALKFSREKLKKFEEDRPKHAVYAAKVLLKFKLLELQKTELKDFCTWAKTCGYLHHLHQYFNELSFENWIEDMCMSLVKSDVATMNNNMLFNK